jgi:hypothetical protein
MTIPKRYPPAIRASQAFKQRLCCNATKSASVGKCNGHGAPSAGNYHHLSQQRLKRYLAEYDFRYNERE